MFRRRSGSFSRFFLEGTLPPPGDSAWVKSFKDHRFRTIEDANSEEESAGWVSFADPSGTVFPDEDCLLDQVVAVRLRLDKKKVPGKWLAIRLAQELRGAGKVSAQRRKEIRQKIADELLPRVLPTVALVDVLIRPRTRELLLFSTAVGAQDALRKLMLTTFGVKALAGDAHQAARRSRLPRELLARLEHVAPFSFAPTPAGRATTPARTVSAEQEAEA